MLLPSTVPPLKTTFEVVIIIVTKGRPHHAQAPASLNKNYERTLPHFKDFQRNLIGTEPIFMGFSANSALISVE